MSKNTAIFSYKFRYLIYVRDGVHVLCKRINIDFYKTEKEEEKFGVGTLLYCGIL